jgi:putative phosphoesterase
MEIGIISDTHSLVRPEVYNVFDGVDLILHAGDIGNHDVIIELEPIAPIKAVVGNNDGHLSHRFDEKITFEMEQRIFSLQHILNDIPEEKEAESSLVREIFIFGHSHQPMNRQVGSTLYFNPGSAGPRRFNLPITVGRISIDKENVRGKIISLE